MRQPRQRNNAKRARCDPAGNVPFAKPRIFGCRVLVLLLVYEVQGHPRHTHYKHGFCFHLTPFLFKGDLFEAGPKLSKGVDRHALYLGGDDTVPAGFRECE